MFLGGSFGLRLYIDFVVGQGFTYGALAAPIGALLFFYMLALAVLLGAELNATIEQTWPSRPAPPAADPPPEPGPGHPDGQAPDGRAPDGRAPDGEPAPRERRSGPT